MNKQHVQLPNGMENFDLTPKDQLIYLSIRRFMDGKTKIAFPSLETISKASGASINTVRNSIKLLEEKDYFEVIKKKRGQEYHFNELKAFEPFSYEFLDKEDLTFMEKSFLVATQQFMFKDIEGFGKISYPNKKLSEMINLSESSIYRTYKSLEKKNYITILKNDSKDIETGVHTDTKIFNLEKLSQAIIWKLKEHEDKIDNNTKEIELLKKQVAEQNRLLQALVNKEVKENKFVMA